MTQKLIPFISQLALSEQLQWLERLNELFKLPRVNQSMTNQSNNDEPVAHNPENNTLDIVNVKVVLASTLSDSEKSQCEIAIVANPEPDVLADFPNLTWVQSLWAGVERLIAEIPSPTFKIVRLIDPCLAKTMGEAVVAWSYYLHRDMPLYQYQQHNHEWKQHNVALTSECTIGVLGLGELGRESANKLALNGFNVLGWSQHKKTSTNFSCFNGRDGLYHVLAESDIVVVLLPLTESTAQLLNRDLFSKMKHGAAIINFARGKLINHTDLIVALNEKMLSHAVLDVFIQEPLPSQDELWQHPNITVLPHISAPTNPKTACQIVLNNIKRYFLSGIIPTVVDLKKGY